MRLFLSLGMAGCLLLVGCGTPAEQLRGVPVAGGHMVGIAFGPNGPLPGKGGGFTVLHAATAPGPEPKQIIYQFALSTPPGAKLKRVIVDDISEEQPSQLVDDEHPLLSDNTWWHIDTAPINSTDPRLAWVFTVTPSMRVYRFTIVDESGHETSFYHLAGFPDFIKVVIRSQWGEKY